jgi:hypothetical protein
MSAFRTLKLRLAVFSALAALAVVLLAPVGQAEASSAYGADGSGFDSPQVSWNSGAQ